MAKNRTPTPVYLDPGMHPGLEVKGLIMQEMSRQRPDISIELITPTMLFFVQAMEAKAVLSNWNHHKCLSQLFSASFKYLSYESTVIRNTYRRQILTYKDDHRAERLKSNEIKHYAKE